MNMFNPLKWLDWLTTEHWSSAMLRERLGQRDDRIKTLEREAQQAALSSTQREAESDRKNNTAMSELEQRHAAEMAKMKRTHSDEILRMAMHHAENEPLRIPESVLRQQKKQYARHDG